MAVVVQIVVFWVVAPCCALGLHSAKIKTTVYTNIHKTSSIGTNSKCPSQIFLLNIIKETSSSHPKNFNYGRDCG
jgi:hypothetical protein